MSENHGLKNGCLEFGRLLGSAAYYFNGIETVAEGSVLFL